MTGPPQKSHSVLGLLVDHLVWYTAHQGLIPLAFGGYLQEGAAEGEHFHLHLFPVSVLSQVVTVGMIESHLYLTASLGQSHLFVQADAIAHRRPGEVAQGEELSLAITAGDGLGTILFLGQTLGRGQDVPVKAMQIEDIGQLGILIISQQPGIGIEFGSQDEFSTESLKDEFILPIVETGA